MIRQLLTVNASRWPSNPRELPSLELGEVIHLRPVAWPETDGLSHRAYLLTLTIADYTELKHSPAIDGVSLHHAGTTDKPIPVEDLLATLGFVRGEQ